MKSALTVLRTALASLLYGLAGGSRWLADRIKPDGGGGPEPKPPEK